MQKKIPHFFKARSRIGLTNKPIRQNEYNFGVEECPDAIVTEDFLKNFKRYEISEYTFSNPEDIDSKLYFKVLADQLLEFAKLINSALKPAQTQVVIGGENTVTFSSLLALIGRVGDPREIGYIQFDSHGEMNSHSGSESKNFHGMYMRPFLDSFDIPEIEALVPKKLKSDQIICIGDQILDGDEPQFYQQKNLRVVKRNEYLKKTSEINLELEKFINRFEYLHINFDIDVFDRSVAGATGIPDDGKWMWGEIKALLDIIKGHKGLSFDLSEVNPSKPGAEKTIKVAQDVLLMVLI